MRGLLVGLAVSLMFAVSAHGQEAAPDTSAVEEAHSVWTASPGKKTRKALDDALEAYSGPPTTATIMAHLKRTSADAKGRKSRTTRESALAAGKHIEPVADLIPHQYADVKMVAAISLFNHKQDKQALIEMAELEAWLHALYHEKGENLDEWVVPFQHRAQAWQLAMAAYYDSTQKRRPSDEELDALTASLHPPGYHGDEVVDEPGNPAELPFCRGEYDQPVKLRYPGKAERKGMFGAVIVQVDTDSSGKFQNVEVLAAVPDEGFKERAVKTISTWGWKPATGMKPSENCRLENTGSVVPIVFSLGR